MGRLDREFKEQTNNEFKQIRYIGNKYIAWLVVVSLLIGALGLGVKAFRVNADRVIFKQSLTYNEGVLDDLAKYKLEMIQCDDEVEKRAIANMVVDRFANYDESKIEAMDLRRFLQDCRNMNVEEY